MGLSDVEHMRRRDRLFARAADRFVEAEGAELGDVAQPWAEAMLAWHHVLIPVWRWYDPLPERAVVEPDLVAEVTTAVTEGIRRAVLQDGDPIGDLAVRDIAVRVRNPEDAADWQLGRGLHGARWAALQTVDPQRRQAVDRAASAVLWAAGRSDRWRGRAEAPMRLRDQLRQELPESAQPRHDVGTLADLISWLPLAVTGPVGVLEPRWYPDCPVPLRRQDRLLGSEDWLR
jgi:hypothetical protein